MKKLAGATLLLFAALYSFSQTVGIGDVTSVESKAASIESNRLRIQQHKADLPALESAWQAKIQKARDELAAMAKERDNLISDMKLGARCSECNRWKTELEKQGINFQQHLGEVKGYAVPATTSELEAVRQSFSERMAVKKVQLQNLEKGDKDVLAKKNAIKQLEDANAKLCQEITAHGKSYETKVFADAKSKHDNWAELLMKYAIDVLIAQDKVAIYKAREIRYEKEFQQEAEKERQRVKKENEQAQQQKNNRIAANEQNLNKLKADRAGFLPALEKELAANRQEKLQTDQQLNKAGLSDSLKAALINKQTFLAKEILALEGTIQEYKESVDPQISKLEAWNKTLAAEIFQLKADLPKQQADAVAVIKPAYDQKKANARQLAVNAETEVAQAKKAYGEKERYYNEQQRLFYNQAENESNRMLIAGQRVSCPVYNDAKGKVAGNWNQVLPCVAALTTQAKTAVYNVFNSYCSGVSNNLSSYKSFLSGLNENDLEAVKQISNKKWFEGL